MALVEILNVSLSPFDSEQLWGCHIDAPKPGGQSEVYAINIEGWVIGRECPVVAVELLNYDIVLKRLPINVDRPDVADAFVDVHGAEQSGFRAAVNVLPLRPLLIKPEIQLFVRAVLENGRRVSLGVIQIRRRPLHSSFQPRLLPLMLTSLGRTGSTWVTHLLGQHPQILAYRPFEYEPKAGRYWTEVLKSLSEPKSYMQPFTVTNTTDEHWWLGGEDSSFEGVIPDLQLQQWLGQNNIEALAAFCQNRIEEFYNQVAIIQGQSEAAYFIEKYSPDAYDRMMVGELYPQACEIILVRDFRDVVCSILAFNAKRGYDAFSRELIDSDENFVKHLQTHAVDFFNFYKSRLGNVHLLRYEDLILRPLDTLTRVLNYLDLDSAPSTVKSTLKRASQETADMQHHRTSPDPQRSIGRWQRDLTPELQAVCQEAFGDVLKEFGYDVD